MVMTLERAGCQESPNDTDIHPKRSQIVAFVSQKGGVGKTTTATHAREWFSTFGSACLVDADAQRSSSRWIANMSAAKQILIPMTVIGDAHTLLKELPKLKEQFDYTIVDAPGSLEDVSRAILSRCDLVVVPYLSGHLDIDSNKKTLEMIEIAQDIRSGMPKAAIFINRAEEGTILLNETKQAVDRDLSNTKIVRLQTIVHKRQCIIDVPGQHTNIFDTAAEIESRRRSGMPLKKKSAKVKLPAEILARNEYDALFKEIARIMNA